MRELNVNEIEVVGGGVPHLLLFIASQAKVAHTWYRFAEYLDNR